MQDIEATLKDKRASRSPKTVNDQEKSEISGGERTSTAATDAGDGGRKRTESAEVGPPNKLSPMLQFTAANSPCMAKADLKEFVGAQNHAVDRVLALNPSQKEEHGRTAYKWPTRTLGSQVGGSLTKLTEHDSVGVGHESCSAAFRLGVKK